MSARASLLYSATTTDSRDNQAIDGEKLLNCVALRFKCGGSRVFISLGVCKIVYVNVNS